MTASFARFGNDLHAGRRIVPIVTRRRVWYLFSLALVVLLAVGSVLRGPNLGIEFTGGSEFQIAGVSDTEQTSARDVVRDHLPGNEPKITVLGGSTLRVQTEELTRTRPPPSRAIWPAPTTSPPTRSRPRTSARCGAATSPRRCSAA